MVKNIDKKVELYLALSLVLLSSLAIIGALVAQYFFNLLPCAWCSLQRLVYLLILILSLIYFVSKFKKSTLFSVGLLGVFGFSCSMYQYFIAQNSDTCDLSVAEQIINFLSLQTLFPKMFAILSMCSSPVNLFGFNLVIISSLVFVLLSAISFILIFYSQSE